MSDEPGLTVAGLRASWLASLAAEGPLPERTVILRNEGIAHAWRRDLVSSSRADLLIGTRFVTPLSAASTILEMAGVSFTLGEESIRPARIAALFAEPLPFRSFDLGVLRSRPGWERAFASTIGDLEAARQSPTTLRSSTDLRCLDIAELWSRLDTVAGGSWTAARALIEAARLLAADPECWLFSGPCLTEVNGHETAAYAAFVTAVPAITFAHIELRPRRTVHAQRTRLLFGEVESTVLATCAQTERGLLAAFLFAPPDEIAASDRPRSAGIDDTVHFEEHAGIEEELDATVSWVISEVADRGTPLEQIGIVVPRIDPYASLLAHRFQCLGPDSVHTVGGAAATSGAGARLATILKALTSYLHIDEMCDVLPILELSNKEANVSRRDAIALLYELGTAGGSAVHPEGALDWAVRRTHREAAITAALADSSTEANVERQTWTLRCNLTLLGALDQPLAALDRAARTLIAGGTLQEQWRDLQHLGAHHVRLGGDGKRVLASIDAAIAPLIAANVLSGEAALEAILGTLEAMRLPVGRFGEPRVTIVSLTDAVGLSFQAVRVMGLAEGAVPSNIREDPVLPDTARTALGPMVRTSTDRTLGQLHALHRIVLTTSKRIVLSTSRMGADGGYREPSGVLIEAAAAVSRAPMGTNDIFIPDAQLMRRTAWEPGRAHLRQMRERWPIDARSSLVRASRGGGIPSSWRHDPLLPFARIPIGPSPSIADGWFPAGAFTELPGLSTERPISASALGQFLECPHRFLYERVLGWHPPPELVEEGTIDALSYGSLFHETAEQFYRSHGAAFCNKAQPLEFWQSLANEIADRRFEGFLESYPLVGSDVRAAQRARLRRDLRSLLETDWAIAKCFVDVERSFGPMELTIGGAPVHVRGFIDRIDTMGATTLVRDLKTGRAKPREKADDLRPSYDVQLGLYGLVTRAKAAEWGVPAAIQGSYVYPADPSGDERSFIDDFDDLATVTQQWIGTAIGMLQQRRFPRTPIEADCHFCSFKPVCGANARARARDLVASSEEVRAFAVMKLGEDEDE